MIVLRINGLLLVGGSGGVNLKGCGSWAVSLQVVDDGGVPAVFRAIGSVDGGGDTIELTVGLVPDGEVSSYLVQGATPGTTLEIRGPLGGWFVWRPEHAEPVQLIGGGTGLVPPMAMVRTHADAHSPSSMRLLYSVRDPSSVLYQAELSHRGET
jgi:ferredoxin-NADP reductase